jgi:DNA polymerase III delta subunit
LCEPSLFDPHRVGIIRNIEKAKAADIEPVTKFLGEHPHGVTLLLIGAELPNSQAFKKSVAEHHVAFEVLKGAELSRWTEREFSLQGIKGVTDNLVEYIIAATEEDPDKISAALEKYTLYLDGEEASITTLQSLFPSQLHASDFELAESILHAPRAKTEVLLQRLLAQGSSPFMLMGLLGKTWVSLSGIAALDRKGLSANEIRTNLAISPWLFNKYLPLAKRLTPELASKGTESLLKADFTLKDRSLGPAAIFSELAQKLKSFQK